VAVSFVEPLVLIVDIEAEAGIERNELLGLRFGRVFPGDTCS